MRRAGPERRARRLVRWYPKEWRRRYGEEFTQLLADDIGERPGSWHRTLDVARGGIGARLAQRELTRMRLAAAALAFGAAIAGAAIVRVLVDPNRQILCPHNGNPQVRCLIVPGHGWVNWAALVIPLLGVAAAASVLLWKSRSRLAAAVLVFAATLAGAAMLHGAVVGRGEFYGLCPGLLIQGGGGLPARPVGECFAGRPGWVDPAALGICLLGVVGAAGLLVVRRR